jgi:hypothetical protein
MSEYLMGFFQVQSWSDTLNDSECSGHPSACKTDEYVGQIKELVHENIHVTVSGLVNEVGVLVGSYHGILTQNLNT